MKCDYCKNKAVVNYQDAIVRFDMGKNGKYKKMAISEDFLVGEEVNKHLCEKHEKEYLEGLLG